MSEVLSGCSEEITLRLYEVPDLDPEIYFGEKILVPKGRFFTQNPEKLEEVEVKNSIEDFFYNYVRQYFIVTKLNPLLENIEKVLLHLNKVFEEAHNIKDFEDFINDPNNQMTHALMLRTMLICFDYDQSQKNPSFNVINPHNWISYISSKERKKVVSETFYKEERLYDVFGDIFEKTMVIKSPSLEATNEVLVSQFLAAYINAWKITSRLNINHGKAAGMDKKSTHVIPYDFVRRVALTGFYSLLENVMSGDSGVSIERVENTINNSLDPVVIATRRISVEEEPN